jgi:predicted dehydrogenase
VRSIGVGIVGTGLAAQVQAAILSRLPDVHIVGFCSSSQTRADGLAREFPGASASTDVRQLVARDDIDLLSVTTEPSAHFSAAMTALEAGKSVLCEKPFALNADEAARMYVTAQADRRLTYVNFEFRRFGPRARLQELIAGGYVGDIRTVYMTGSSNYYQLKGPNQSPWWLTSARGGGWLGASGSHDLDALRFLIGEISDVCADLPQFVSEHPVRDSTTMMSSDVDDCALLLLRFHNNAHGVLATTAAATTPTLGSRIEICGSEGTLVLSTPTRSGGPLYEGVSLLGRRSGADDFEQFPIEIPESSSSDPHTGPGALWLADVIGSLRRSEPITPDFQDGFEDQLLLDAARQSARERRWVDVAELRTAVLDSISATDAGRPPSDPGVEEAAALP